MGGKPRFKDWRPGEWRFKVHVVSPTGSSLNLYIDRVSGYAGKVLWRAINTALHSKPTRGKP